MEWRHPAACQNNGVAASCRPSKNKEFLRPAEGTEGGKEFAFFTVAIGVTYFVEVFSMVHLGEVGQFMADDEPSQVAWDEDKHT